MPLGPPDLSGTARRFSTPVTRRRYSAPTTTAEGLLADGAPADTPGRAHHWPARGETLERLGEGTEGQDVREGTTTMDLRAPDPVTGARADSLQVGAVEYQVVETAPRNVSPSGVVTWRSFVMVEIPTRS